MLFVLARRELSFDTLFAFGGGQDRQISTNALRGHNSVVGGPISNLTIFPTPTHREESFDNAITNYLEDICYYIGICGENQYGYYRVLDMGSIYFPDGDRSKYPDLKPFEGISLEENKEIEERCSRLREKFGATNLKPLEDEILNPDLNSEKVCKMLEKYEAEARGWSFHLMHENKTHCGVTAVTSRHFVTSSECIRNMLEILNGNNTPLHVK
ncbi:hypothetical protein DdX_17913 [Ditylenchus destructor]|uniref:Uncharacterized protein n=1 Tax=Ditylenchus destructor TaxID=166010 RepID=A0AAD4QYK1_9BILA|nr:hypothetical protein DdX_17913 [Ditylenchus destructor]